MATLESEVQDLRNALSRSSGSLCEPETSLSWINFFRFAGPGIIMCTAFIDPGDLEADLQAGAQYRYMMLWCYLWTTVMGYFMQMLAAKLGVASGKDLATMCREEYPPCVRWILWVIIEASLMGVEIQYVIGAGVGLSLMCDGLLPLWAAVLVCGGLAYLTLMMDRYGVKAVEMMFLGMIGVMVVSFTVLAIKAKAPGDEVMLGLAWPQMPMQVPGSDYNSATTDLLTGGILGGAMSPYNFYFFSMLVLKRELPMASRGEKAHRAHLLLHRASHIWAIGLFATGLSSTTAAVYAGQAIMSGFIDIKVSIWWRAIISRSFAIVPALVVAATQRQDQTELDNMNLWLNLLQTIALPFALLPLLHFTCNKRIMGKHWANNIPVTVLAIIIALFAIAVAIYATVMSTPLPSEPYAVALGVVGVSAYGAAIGYFLIGPDRVERWWALLRAFSRSSGGAVHVDLAVDNDAKPVVVEVEVVAFKAIAE
ncbi:MAG: hypothetical protein WDW38_010362 [Sanguina aurantia]